MSALTPLYLLGVLAIAAPIVFHLIRRSPRGEVPFSSLIFLAPSPPRLTRRSRLDNILLLLLRAAALCLLAFAFARPFFRQEARWNLGDQRQRRIALLIDNSASMRRGDLWPKAKAMARQVVSECGPTDEIALIAFDRTSRMVLGFGEWSSVDPARRQSVADSRIDGLEPSWGATDLGRSLIDAVAAIEDTGDTSERNARTLRRVVLVSDLQQGSHLDALGDFDWPSDVELEIKSVSDDSSNAGLQRLADPTEGATSASDRERRVRVFNDPDSHRERFSLRWTGAGGSTLGDPIDVYVPPGESRVVRVPRPAGNVAPRAIVLRGDTAAFDNTLHVFDEPGEEATVVFIGDDRPDDKEGLLFYLMRVFIDTPRRSVRVVAERPGASLSLASDHSTPLVIVTAETSAENRQRLRQYVQSGGTLLYVASQAGRGETLAALLGSEPRPLQEANVKRDVLIGEVAFDHPLFAPLAGAQYSDFTKIRFWKYRKLDIGPIQEDQATRQDQATREGEAPSEPENNATRKESHPPGIQPRVLARFENGDPAIIEKAVDKGTVVVMASGWNRVDSQLARSSKFVPMMAALLDRRDPLAFDAEDHTVGDRVTLPAPRDAATGYRITKPSGSTVLLAPGSTSFDQADEPGIYSINAAGGPREFVVNLDPAESKTAAMGVETLEQFGCRLANPTRDVVDREQMRQMHNAELEGRQKLWRWLIVGAIGVLIVETGLAGRVKRTRPNYARAEALSS